MSLTDAIGPVQVYPSDTPAAAAPESPVEVKTTAYIRLHNSRRQLPCVSA
ncbi:MAG TPA: hypothetical protein VHU83_25335 [Bryobacteraceae bacterium]|nr:hypothetical protein [Bryobacteraceae bacterium]